MTLIYKDGGRRIFKYCTRKIEWVKAIRVCRLSIDEEIIRCFHFFNVKRVYGTEEREPH